MILPSPNLIAHLETVGEGAMAVVEDMESLPRDDWKSVPTGYIDADRQSWRYRRRLSVARRPLLRLGSDGQANILVAPGMIREGLGATVHNMYEGSYEAEHLSSREMRLWRDKVSNECGYEFEGEVAEKLRALGLSVRKGIAFGEILGFTPEENLGDIDVLAWKDDGRIVLLECKSLQFAKTPSEIAKQLVKYRGEVDAKGRLDKLDKHLHRWKLARQHEEALARFVGSEPIDFRRAG